MYHSQYLPLSVYTSDARMKYFESQMCCQTFAVKSKRPLQIGSYYKNGSKLEGNQARDQVIHMRGCSEALKTSQQLQNLRLWLINDLLRFLHVCFKILWFSFPPWWGGTCLAAAHRSRGQTTSACVVVGETSSLRSQSKSPTFSAHWREYIHTAVREESAGQ